MPAGVVIGGAYEMKKLSRTNENLLQLFARLCGKACFTYKKA